MGLVMELDKARSRIHQIAPLQLREAQFCVNPTLETVKRLFRSPLAGITITVTAGAQTFTIDHNTLSDQHVRLLETDPSNFLIGDGPFLCGTGFYDSYAEEIAHQNQVPSDALFIFDGDTFMATIHADEIPRLLAWLKTLTD